MMTGLQVKLRLRLYVPNRGKSSQDTFCRQVKLERLAMKELQK